MKSDSIHITLCCEHCGERVPIVMVHDFPCPHCQKRCKANGMVAGALLKMAKRIQAMTPVEQAAIFENADKLKPTGGQAGGTDAD